jgi:hypothetical protein
MATEAHGRRWGRHPACDPDRDVGDALIAPAMLKRSRGAAGLGRSADGLFAWTRLPLGPIAGDAEFNATGAERSADQWRRHWATCIAEASTANVAAARFGNDLTLG